MGLIHLALPQHWRAIACGLSTILLFAGLAQAQAAMQPPMLPLQSSDPTKPLSYWYNCQTREVWLPDKRRWCDRLIQISNGSHQLTAPVDQVIPLREGQYAEDLSPLRVTLINRPGRTVVMDLDGDRHLDAATLLTVNDNENRTLQYLSVALANENQLGTGQAVFLGECIEVRSIRLQDGLVTVALQTHTETDALCSPTQDTIRQFTLNEGDLTLVEAAAMEPITP